MFVRSRPQGELGSPPQVRGKQDNPPTVLPEAGITPAGAGKTSICAVRQADTEDHPRRCGENLTTFPQSSASAGSPPQVRGKHPPHFNASRRRRITPAGAGKTGRFGFSVIFKQDHPRRCGENDGKWGKKSQFAGSPPQVRGKLHCIIRIAMLLRITPAGAGKTSSPVTSVNPPQDHPRRCGENSPALLRRQRLSGITPAGAGKTCCKYPYGWNTRDHPRRCGENPDSDHRPRQGTGITPAGAGKT